VLPKDFYSLVPSLLSATFFEDFTASEEQLKDLKTLVTRWNGYLQSGQFSLSVKPEWRMGEPCQLADFWTSPSPYAVMASENPVLVEELKQSGLVIFKVCSSVYYHVDSLSNKL
jgi:hypothetical protein